MAAPVLNTPTTRSSARGFAGVLLASLAALGAIEIVLRAFDLPARESPILLAKPQWRSRTQDFVPDKHTLWRLAGDRAPLAAANGTREPPAPDRVPPDEVNRLGLRGHEPDATKTDRHFRIAVVGDAIACGLGVDLDDCFAMRLARTAQQEAPGARIDTFILGVPGFTTLQSLRLWQQLGAAFAPDLVILYSTGWEDLQPAAHASDADLLREVDRPARWRLPQLLRHLSPRSRPTTADGHLEPGSEPPNGRRVPIAEFKANVAALIAGARQAGAAVSVVVPALADDIEKKHPVALLYRETLRDAATAGNAALIDADGLATNYESSIVAPPCADVGTTHGFRHGIALTAAMHALLADVLLTHVRMHPRFAELCTRAAPGDMQLRSIEPSAVDALAQAEITLRGSGFAGAHGLRLWIGSESTGAVQAVDDTTVKARLPIDVVPGLQAISLATASGLVQAPAEVAVTIHPAALDVTLQRAGDKVTLSLSGTAPAGCRVQVWASSAGRAHALETHAGPFWLQYGTPGEKPSRAPFCFAALPLPSFSATAGSDGRWQTTVPWDPATNQGAPTGAFQGVVWLPGDMARAVATKVIVRVLPR